MENLWLWAFWGTAAAFLYGYAGFPALVALVGRVRNRTVRTAPITPSLSVIVAAYNEEAALAARLENVLACDYPAEALEVVVASDGSTDATEAIVAAYGDRGVRLLRLPRRGKIHALHDAVGEARGEVLVFTDANALFETGALRALAANFADPEVGGVAGRTVYRELEACETSGAGESLYWRYDTWLKQLESRTGSVVSAHGALYAIRRSLYRRPADAAVTDDFAISTAVVAQGRRLVFESAAVAYERPVDSTEREFRRRVRLMTRGLRSLAARRALLDPFRYGFYALVLASHKLWRRLLPLGLPVLFVASLALAPHGPVYGAAAVAQVAFYALAGLGYAARRTEVGRAVPLLVPFYYCTASAAALLALLHFLRGDRIERWQPQRHEPASPAASPAAGPQGGP